MIETVKIKAFKSLVDVEISLGAVNVLVGANGSGKSNILEALGILGAAAAGRVDDEGSLHRGVRPGLPALFKSSFLGKKQCNAIRLSADGAGASYEVELYNPVKEEKPAWTFKTERLLSGKEKIVGRSGHSSDYQSLNAEEGLAALKRVALAPSDPAFMLLNALTHYAVYAPNTPSLRGIMPDPQSRTPVGLHGGRLAEALARLRDLSRKAPYFEDIMEDLYELIDWVKEMDAREANTVPLSPSVPSPRKVVVFRDRFMAANRNLISGYDASEGALYVLFAAVLAALPEAPPLLAIDNIAASLNPRLGRALTARLCDWMTGGDHARQLLLSCHNPLVLDGLNLLDDRIRLFAVDRNVSGHTVVRRVAVDEALMEKARNGRPLSRLWVSGHLGGMPDV